MTRSRDLADFADSAANAEGARPLILYTAKTATGTSVDFSPADNTGIPSWAKQITVMFNGVSTNGSSPIQVQVGDSGGVELTGYDSYGVAVTAASGVGGQSSTTGFITSNGVNAASSHSGVATIASLGANTWCFSAQLASVANARCTFGSGAKTLSDTLDRVRITTVNGTDTFDAGSINIMVEG
jgi:hypothetical protein